MCNKKGNCSGVGQTGGLPWSVDILQTKREPIPKGLYLSAQPRVVSRTRLLGWRTQSLWDWRTTGLSVVPYGNGLAQNIRKALGQILAALDIPVRFGVC